MTQPIQQQTITTRAAARQRGYSLIDLPDGRCRARVDTTPKDSDGHVIGPRREATRILPNRDEAQAWAESTRVAARQGTHIARAADTFDGVADQWLADLDVRPITLRGYKVALQPARDALGHKRVQTVTPADLRALMRSLAHRGQATNSLTLYTVRATLALAVADGLIPTNPAAGMKARGKKPKQREELPAKDADLIAAHVRGSRLEACWLLTLAGLRRSEVMGIRWSDLTDDSVTVARGRVDTGEVGPTKSTAGTRTLPLTPDMAAAVTRTRAARRREVLALGAGWDESSFVAVDPLLQPLRPEVYSDEWADLLVAAKCTSRVTLHGARHGSVTRMLDAGVPLHVVQAWHGHSDPSMTLRYAHARRDGLAEAAGVAYGAAQ